MICVWGGRPGWRPFSFSDQVTYGARFYDAVNARPRSVSARSRPMSLWIMDRRTRPRAHVVRSTSVSRPPGREVSVRLAAISGREQTHQRVRPFRSSHQRADLPDRPFGESTYTH